MPQIGTCNFYDENGQAYNFEVYTHDSDFPNAAGVYIFTKRNVNASGIGIHEPIYIGEAESFRDRPLDSRHFEWMNAIVKGFTHICIHYNLTDRVTIQNRLIAKYNPPLNNQNPFRTQ